MAKKESSSKYRKVRKVLLIPAELLPVKSVRAKIVNGTVEVFLTVPSLPKAISEHDAQFGHNRFFVANAQLGIYTCIGAENIHHASNKCTILFGPKWSFIREEHNCTELRGFVHQSVHDFNELIKTLPN